MPRKPSVVITPAEKKEMLKAAKLELKEAKAVLAEIGKRGKAVEKERKALLKLQVAEDKQFAKETSAAEKLVVQIENKITSLVE